MSLLAVLGLALWADPIGLRSAQASIVPPEPLALGGYTARGGAKFEPGGEELFARALILEQAETRVAIVTVDSLTIPESLYESVRAALPEDLKLLLIATHTHSAPDSQMLNSRMRMAIPGIATYSRSWSRWYAEKISAAILQALVAERNSVASLEFRRVTTDLARARRESAKPDGRLGVLTGPGGRVLLTHLAAHATVLDESNLRLSGDWPGRTAAAVGGLALPGAIGDASPNVRGDSEDPLAEYSSRIIEHVRNSLSRSGETVTGELAFESEEIDLGDALPHPDFGKANGIPDALAGIVVGNFAPQAANLALLAIGGFVVIGVPGEPTAELGRRIEAIAQRNGFRKAIVVSHCNGWIGYILTKSDYDRGGYEATLALHGPETASKVLSAADVGLRRLSGITFPRDARRRKTPHP